MAAAALLLALPSGCVVAWDYGAPPRLETPAGEIAVSHGRLELRIPF